MANNNDEQNVLSKISNAFKNLWKEVESGFSELISANTIVSNVISQTQEAITELKEVNTLLTDISKANDSLSKSELEQIGDNSFDVASKYGKSATDYLTSVQEALDNDYQNAEEIAELSLAIQCAGDITSELANQYITATDQAYELNGSVSTLKETLDGANNITNQHTVSMTELAEGMSAVGSQAASSHMEVDETTAAIGTLIAVTDKSGSEMGNAFKGILMNLQQVTGEVEDGGDPIDESSLAKYEEACNKLGVSLTTVKNGAVTLKEPMQILKELSTEYAKLNDSDSKRTSLLNAVGGNDRADALNALLENYDLYEQMLQEYADGTGSMAADAEKTVNSWEGSLNRLSNTWTDTVGNIANSDAIIAITNCLNELLLILNKVTDFLGSFGTIGLGAGLVAGIKNIGITYECM